MKHMLLTFDIEEFDELRIHKIPGSEKERCQYSAQGLKAILNLLKKYEAKATFFTTYIFAKHHPELIKQILKEKHELGLHAYKHGDDYTNMPEEESYKILATAKKEIEKICKVKLVGFRGPQMRRPSYAVLKRLGFTYDSSVHPTWMLAKLKHLTKPRKVYKTKEGIIEVPLAVSPILRLSVAWILFRNFPLWYTKLVTKMIFLNTNFATFYFHPWEFIDIGRFKTLMVFIRRKTGFPNLRKLEKCIIWAKKQKYQTATISNYLAYEH